MNTYYLYIASTLSGITTIAHVVIGGKQNAAPLFADPDLPIVPKVTVAFAWHAASIFLLFVTIIFLWAAVSDSGRQLVFFTVAHCASLSCFGFYFSYTAGLSPWTFPPAMLFALIALFGSLSLIGVH